MTKSDRYLFIQTLCRKVSKPRVAVLVALPAEIAEETALAARHNDDESIIDVETNVSTISPELAASVDDIPPARHYHVGEDILTTSERKQMKQDLAAYRSKERAKWQIVPASFFVQTVFSS